MRSRKPQAQPWEQLPDETASAYRAFRHYLETTPIESRSVRGTYRQLYGKPTAIQAAGYVSAWSTRYRWAERARQYDTENARREYEAMMRALEAKKIEWAKRREKIAEDDYLDGAAGRKKYREMIAAPTFRQTITREEVTPDGRTIIQHITLEPVNFTFAQAAQILKMASERQRLAAEMATAIVETVTPESQAEARLKLAREALDEHRELYPEVDDQARLEMAAGAFGVTVEELARADREARENFGEPGATTSDLIS